MPIVISPDEIKKSLPNYSPERAGDFHEISAKQADKEFDKVVKSSNILKVILMSGGTASGKTEFLMTQLESEKCIVLDGTLPTPEGARIKISKIIKAKKKPIIYSVIPDDLTEAFNAFLQRDRKFSDIHFYKTHSGSRKALLWVAENFPNVEINLIESSYSKSHKMIFKRLVFSEKNELLQYLRKLQMTEADIISKVNEKLSGSNA